MAISCIWGWAFKINVDASVFPYAKRFSIKMVLRNHEGNFMTARNYKISRDISISEIKAFVVRKALSLIKEMQR